MIAAPDLMPAAPAIEGAARVARDPASLHPCTACERLSNGVYCTHYRAVMPEPAKPNACVRFEPKGPATPWS